MFVSFVNPKLGRPFPQEPPPLHSQCKKTRPLYVRLRTMLF